MKKFVLLTFLIFSFSFPAFANNNIKVVLDNNPINAEATIVEGRTLVAVRGVFENMGYNINFDANTKTATISNEKNVIKLTNGNTYFTLNDNIITPDVPQQIINGRFMLPLRAISEAINADVSWDNNTKTVSIKTGLKIENSLNLDLIDLEQNNIVECH